MSKHLKIKAAHPVPHTNLAAELGQMRLLPGEDDSLFQRFCERALQEIKPSGLIEELLVGDYIYHAWEVMRYRRYKTNLQRLASARSAAVLASSSSGGAEDAPALPDVLILGEADTVFCPVFTETLSGKLDLIERLDDLLDSAEARRTAAYGDLLRHRKALAEQAKATVERIEDGEFRTLAPDDGDEPRLKTYVR